MLIETKNTTVIGRSEITNEDGSKQTIVSMNANYGENGVLSVHIEIMSPAMFKENKESAQSDIMGFVEKAIKEDI